MWFAKSENGFRGWFSVTDSRGSLVTGLLDTDFLVTVRNPQDSDQSIPIVIESGKPGLYRFDIDNSFLQSYGKGTYAVVIEISTTLIKDIVTNILQVSINDFDSLTTGSVQISQQNIQEISAGVWNLELTGTYNSLSAADLLLSSSTNIDQSFNVEDIWSYNIFGSSAENLLFSSSLATPQSSSIDYSLISESVWTYDISGSKPLDLLLTSSNATTASIDYQQVSSAVWDADVSFYSNTNTFGNSITTISSSISVMSDAVTAISQQINEIKDIQYGRWKIENNQMIFYKEDNITEVARFDLYDSSGVPTMDAVFERIKV
jgi:hypothetical protein